MAKKCCMHHCKLKGVSSAHSSAAMASLDIFSRYNFGGRIPNEKGRWRKLVTPGTNAPKKNMLSIFPLASSRYSSRAKIYQEVQKDARKKFIQEISFKSKDRDISLAKALLYVATEDEAFMAFNREMDANSIQKERRSASLTFESLESTCMESMPLAGKNMNEWMAELDAISREVEAELAPRETGCNLAELLDAVNIVLFKSRGFKRSSVPANSTCSYLHSALSSGHCSAILLSVVYIEVCRRLNLTIVGSAVGEDFLIWPLTGNPQELFKITSGRSLFGIVNGKCVNDPRSMASDININSLTGLEIATNRDIIGIALANLIRLHWKCASRANHGLMLTSPLRSTDNFSTNAHLVRPQDLRLAIMASERLLILQPQNWSLRRDHGMMLYYSREYEEAVKELSICMAFAPEEESQVLEPFVEKLHLLCLESSWKSLGHKGHLSVP